MQVFPEQTWKESLCGCFHDRRICCYGFWCCCCLYGENTAKIDHRRSSWVYTCQYGLLSLFGCCCLVHSITRGKLRAKYGLEEDACGDCCTTWFCPFCAICQEAREIEVRGYPPPPIIIIHPPALSISSASVFD